MTCNFFYIFALFVVMGVLLFKLFRYIEVHHPSLDVELNENDRKAFRISGSLVWLLLYRHWFQGDLKLTALCILNSVSFAWVSYKLWHCEWI
jgi:hypothetical protein